MVPGQSIQHGVWQVRSRASPPPLTRYLPHPHLPHFPHLSSAPGAEHPVIRQTQQVPCSRLHWRRQRRALVAAPPRLARLADHCGDLHAWIR